MLTATTPAMAPSPTTSLLLLLLGAVTHGALAQDEPQRPAPPEPHFRVLRYPRDRDAPVAMVGERPLTLEDLVRHIDGRHYPGFAVVLEQRPEIQRYLQSDLIAPWVRHFADIKALELTTADRGIDRDALDAKISARLKSEFEAWLATYLENLGKRGHPTKLTQQQVNSRLAEFQLRRGLAIELQGWLDYLEPGDYTREELHAFFTANARYFGGKVTVAHILIQHRDAGTGILLKNKGLAQAEARLADVRLRLEPDGSNFAEVARLMSEDAKTRNEGGLIAGISRFDHRLPAELCRAAWRLRDGEVSDVIESRYGYHFLYRKEFNQNIYVLFTDDAMPAIETVMLHARQEDLLFGAREKARLKLKL